MSLPEEMAADLAELELEIPQTFSWNGGSYSCVTGGARRSKQGGPGGFGLEADLTIYVRAELFSAADLATLKAGTKNRLTFDEHSYRIDQAYTPPGQPLLKLVCNDAAQV